MHACMHVLTCPNLNPGKPCDEQDLELAESKFEYRSITENTEIGTLHGFAHLISTNGSID